MEKSFVPEEVTTEQLFEFIHRLNFEKLEIESINFSFTTKIDESQKVEVSIEDIIDTDAKADFN